MKFVLKTTTHSFTFSTLSDAEQAQKMALSYYPGDYTYILKVADALAGWLPDAGDNYALQFMMDLGNKMAAIRFARMKSGAGLKETKDWVESQF